MELTTMKNIGVKMNKKLHAVGIHTAEELLAIGSKEAFFRLKTAYPEVCLVHLYSLQGAIDDVDFNGLSQEQKSKLKVFSNTLK